jgi:hypothetical protein
MTDPVAAAELWRRVDDLIDRAPTIDDLRAHRLELLAARRWRELGMPVPAGLEEQVRGAAIVSLAAGAVLTRVCDAVQAPVLHFKGMEAAALYPHPETRPFGDVDLLVEDAEAAQRSLLEAGFQTVETEIESYDELHHLAPLVWPELPVVIEVHRRPAWPEWMPQPRIELLIEAAVPSRTGIEGLMAPAPAHHALLVAAHAWDFNPLGRIIDLLDVQLLAAEAGRDEVAHAARGLRVAGLWKTTLEASDALFASPGRGRIPRGARNLAAARDSTVLGQHVRQWTSPFWVLSPARAIPASVTTIVREALPAGGETWGGKYRRVLTAARNGFRRKWHHDAEIGDAAVRPPRRPRY